MLCACASSGKNDKPLVSGSDVNSVAMQPLHDINVVQQEIPAVLLAAEKSPYAQPADCTAIISEIHDLDAALGPDLDEVPLKEEAPLVSYRSAGIAANDLVRDAALGWIPFRGAIRTVSGAERHTRAVRSAILGGTVRRAYLKGYGEKLGCARPASPLHAAVADEQHP